MTEPVLTKEEVEALRNAPMPTNADAPGSMNYLHRWTMAAPALATTALALYAQREADAARIAELERQVDWEAQAAKLRSVLKLFGNVANNFDDTLDPDDRLVGPFQLGFYRRARAALGES